MNWKHSSPEASNENIKSAMHEKKRREKNTEKWKPSIIFILGACRKAVVWTVLYLKMNISIHPFFWSRPKTFSVKLLSSFGWFAFRLDWISSREKKTETKTYSANCWQVSMDMRTSMDIAIPFVQSWCSFLKSARF